MLLSGAYKTIKSKEWHSATMGVILKTATLALLLMGGANGKELEKTTIRAPEENSVAQEKTYRQRPPRECCDATQYGGTPPQTPADPKALYLGLLFAATALAGHILRKRQDAVIEKYQPQREWDFCGTRPPVVDYEIERED